MLYWTSYWKGYKIWDDNNTKLCKIWWFMWVSKLPLKIMGLGDTPIFKEFLLVFGKGWRSWEYKHSCEQDYGIKLFNFEIQISKLGVLRMCAFHSHKFSFHVGMCFSFLKITLNFNFLLGSISHLKTFNFVLLEKHILPWELYTHSRLKLQQFVCAKCVMTSCII